MEYILGSTITIATMFLVARLFSKQLLSQKPKLKIFHSQSRAHYMTGSLSFEMSYPFEPLMTQASKHSEKVNFRVLIVNDLAYYIKDSKFYVSEMNDGILNEETTKLVDIMSMDKVQLEDMYFIIEKLTEGTSNDTRNPGNS